VVAAAKGREFPVADNIGDRVRDAFCSNSWREIIQIDESSSFRQGVDEKLNRARAAAGESSGGRDRSHWIRLHIPVGPLLAMTLSGGSCRQHP
jgi:hypothetical protein